MDIQVCYTVALNDKDMLKVIIPQLIVFLEMGKYVTVGTCELRRVVKADDKMYIRVEHSHDVTDYDNDAAQITERLFDAMQSTVTANILVH